MLRGPLHEKRLKLPVGERPPKPLEWTEGEETQPQQASGNVDGPHAHYNVDLLVVLQRAIQLPWTPFKQELADHAAGPNFFVLARVDSNSGKAERL
jgi:hypothetical protein